MGIHIDHIDQGRVYYHAQCCESNTQNMLKTQGGVSFQDKVNIYEENN